MRATRLSSSAPPAGLLRRTPHPLVPSSAPTAAPQSQRVLFPGPACPSSSAAPSAAIPLQHSGPAAAQGAWPAAALPGRRAGGGGEGRWPAGGGPRAARWQAVHAASASFRTEIEAAPLPCRLQYEDQVVLLGSCFAEVFGRRLTGLKFRCEVNPFGIAFNPVSISHALTRMAEGRQYTAAELAPAGGGNGLWCSVDHHSSFSRGEAAAAAEAVNGALLGGRRALLSARHLVLTLGTAWVHEVAGDSAWSAEEAGAEAGADGGGTLQQHTGRVVANCHKIPARNFRKRLLSVQEVVEATVGAVERVVAEREAGAPLQVLVTVSPVRHWRDGAVESARSKAVLVVAAHEAVQALQAQARAGGSGAGGGGLTAAYFPSYELLMDDLRDYRFYAEDMVHPSGVAEEYIWGKLRGAWLAPAADELASSLEALQRAVAHRPLAPGSPAHRSFVEAQLRGVERLEARGAGEPGGRHVALDLSAERAHFLRALQP